MSPYSCLCFLCGTRVANRRRESAAAWRRQHRIVYADDDGVHLSGVGIYDYRNDGDWYVPLDQTVDWSIPEEFDYETGTFIPVYRQPPDDDHRHGYVVHKSCWSLLEQYFSPQAVDLSRLNELMTSLPQNGLFDGAVLWGHDYGGLLLESSKSSYPWEDKTWRGKDNPQAVEDSKIDPFNVPLSEVLVERVSDPPPPRARLGQSRDCFSALPLEILETIAVLLSTTDALALRSASRTYLPLFQSQTFWASRFSPPQDRGFVFEARGARRDWRSLWRATARPTHPGLRNRKRIWSLLQIVSDLMSLEMASVPQCPREDGLQKTDGPWMKAAANVLPDLMERTAGFTGKGCIVVHKRRIALPSKASKVAATVITLGKSTFISGLRFVGAEMPGVAAGYIRAENERVVQVSGSITGFSLAIGSKGVQALQIVVDGQQRLPWLGDPRDVPITDFLANVESFGILEAGFDAFKLVYLALSQAALRFPPTMREKAHWYPCVPPAYLNLNDTCYTGEDPLTAEYRPLFWSHFGGPGGTYLGNLTGLTVVGRYGVFLIEFVYNSSEVNGKVPSLGLCRVDDGHGDDEEGAKVDTFPIDGPGGERIERIEVHSTKLPGEDKLRIFQHGKLRRFKVTTSWNRSHLFCSAEKNTANLSLQTLVATPGATISGLYAAECSKWGLSSLGIISETMKP